MPGAKKKKKKPAANPARGFATTSIASKPRVDPSSTAKAPGDPPSPNDAAPPSSSALPAARPGADSDGQAAFNSKGSNNSQALTPEEFERQLEESELQLL